MESKTKELVALGYRRADELKSCPEAWDPRSVAKLIIDLAAQLDVTAVVLREKSKQCDALAAENAGLKVSISEGCQWDGEQWVGLSAETPATDAFLREQMAKGVEKFAAHKRSLMGLPGCSDAAISYAAKSAERYAAQLRAGEAV
ncbi:hypothetical protein LMA04_17815 [Pseudescherichia vulneris]|uniref:hypothetical protein n=1 Tax=Pseudescherichia vulneris TaxID=566 RepID=UPI00227A3070|nr:hypothetical protein [Pseudescherichia vulneris]WAH51931.1 hypothetical protein LMA04_17815 [Pseudescherichia vulneris]